MNHSPETIREALSHIPAHDRELWVRMGMAVKSELGEAGFDMWDEWSQSADNYQAKAAKNTWKGIRESGPVTIGSLFFEAQQHGFRLNGQHKPINGAELARLQKEREEHQRAEAEAKAARQTAAAKLAEEIYAGAAPATTHPYLTRKRVPAAPGVRVGRWWQIGEDGKKFREVENCLLIPMRDEDGKLWNLQAIFPEHDFDVDRDRDYLMGGRKQGCYFPIGKPNGSVAVGEGYATMQSVRAATGLAVCVAFDKGNLLPVSIALRSKLSDIRLILAADNDIREGKPNYGLEKATEAAAQIGGYVAVPELNGEQVDFNDLHLKRGPETVKAAIEGARPATIKKHYKAKPCNQQKLSNSM